MSYGIRFREKPDGSNQWVYVGDEWINLTTNAATLVKEACGLYPSQWNGKKCGTLGPTLMYAATRMRLCPDYYKKFEDPGGWGTVSNTADLLQQIAEVCNRFPDAVFDVSC